MTAPRCRKCSKVIAQQRRDTNLRTQEQAGRGIGGSSWLTVPQLPQTIEEAQRLTNYKITKVWWASPGQGDQGINSIRHWDGESYAFRYGHFCSVKCAAEFGRIMADGEQS